MFRYIAPIILVGVAVAGFFLYAKPLWDESKVIKTEIASYDEALTNAKTLESERYKLTQKYNAIDPNNLSRLEKMLPENVDNIRLVLEIGNIAQKYGMELTGISYDSTIDNKKSSKDNKDKTETPSIGTPTIGSEYGEWTLGFSTTGTYETFLSFLKDLENNLRIVDISNITFSSDTSGGGVAVGKPKSKDSYTYGFTIKTYWLKN
jgi:Tfp pilus assembly protein PilO